MKGLAVIVLFLSFLRISFGQDADKVFKNAKVYTTNNTFHEAIAIKDDAILYIGTDAGVQAHIGTQTYVEDLDGKLVLPGLHDVHMHPLEASSPVGGSCTLDNLATDPQTLVTELTNCNLTVNSNGWITGWGFSIFTFLPFADHPKYPYEYLDEVFPTQPAMIMEETSHSIWVNSAAMNVLGITSSTVDPAGGHIIKDVSNGNIPIGLLLDNAGDKAVQLAFASNAGIDANNKAGLVDYGLPLLAENGITSICEGRTYWKRNYHTIWQSIKDDGDLTCRVILAPWAYPEDDNTSLINALTALYSQGDDMLKTTQIKLYSDGILINGTSAMHQPYNYSWDLPFDSGLNYIDEARMTALITALEPIGYDFHIHAIGDRGITESLNAIEAATDGSGRHRITHLEILNASDLPRFQSLNVTADMQVAGSFTNPSNWSENNFLIGAARTDSIIPIKALENAGARITLSSDWDVSSINPFVGMKNAITRVPQEISSIEKAVQAYTIDAAYVMRQEDKTGSLEVGKWADFIVVDRDVFTIPSNQVGQTKTLLTYVGGNEVYRSENLAVPVQLLFFDAVEKDCEVVLNWATLNEINNKKFIIEKSSNGTYFRPIGEVDGRINSSSRVDYVFIDVESDGNNYYRLKQVDLDGREEMHEVIFAKGLCFKELSIKVTPNITSYLSMIQIVYEETESIQVSLYTGHGSLVKSFAIKHKGGVSQHPLNVTFLPEGLYLLELKTEKGQALETQKIIVSR